MHAFDAHHRHVRPAIKHVHMLEVAIKLPCAWEAAMRMPVHARRGPQ